VHYSIGPTAEVSFPHALIAICWAAVRDLLLRHTVEVPCSCKRISGCNASALRLSPS